MARGLLVERAVVSRQQILGEGKFRHHLLELDPEPPAHAFAVLRQPVGRFKTHGVFGRWHRGAPSTPGAADRRGCSDKNWGCPAAAARRSRPAQPSPSCLAIAFMAMASWISSLVTPPASWVASTTSTVL